MIEVGYLGPAPGTQEAADQHYASADLIDRLRASGAVLTYDPDTRTIRTSGSAPIAATAGQER